MREGLLIGLAVFIGVAGAIISALPVIVWFRRRKAAAALYDEFLEAAPGVIGFRYRREKKPFGDGFLDSYTGQIGETSFLLAVEIVPRRKFHGYRLRLDKRIGGESLVYEMTYSADPAGSDPLAIAASALRNVHAKREGYYRPEAS